MNLVNLTGHDVFLYKNGSLAMRYEASGDAIRIQPIVQSFYEYGDITVNDVEYTQDTKLPAPSNGTFYIVSFMIANFYKKERDDLVFPFEIVRGNGGKVIGCRSFARPL